MLSARSRKYINAALSGIIVALFVVFVLSMWFIFAEYSHASFSGERFIPQDAFSIEGVIEYDSTGAPCGVQGGTEVTAFLSGWFPRKMYLLRDGDDAYLFDPDDRYWLIAEKRVPEFTRENVVSVTAMSYTEDEVYTFTDGETDELFRLAEKLRDAPYGTLTDTVPPAGRSMYIAVRPEGFPENSSFTLFSYTVTDTVAMLISHTDSFGFGFGDFINLPGKS